MNALRLMIQNVFARVCLRMKKNDFSAWFSDEIVDAFRKVVHDNDYRQLERHFEGDELKWIRMELWTNHHIGEPDDEYVDQEVRTMLNRLFGADF